MDKVLKRRLWLSAGAVVAGAALGLSISHFNAPKRARPVGVLQPVSIVIQPAGKASPLGKDAVVARQDPLGRLLVAGPGGPAGTAVFEPAPGTDLNQAMIQMMQWVDADTKLTTVYVTRPPAPKAAKP